jgi:hypothetical protein
LSHPVAINSSTVPALVVIADAFPRILQVNSGNPQHATGTYTGCRSLRARYCLRRTAYAMILQPASQPRSATTVSGRQGITAYLKNGGTLKRAAAIANHELTRATQLQNRRHDAASLEVERIAI